MLRLDQIKRVKTDLSTLIYCRLKSSMQGNVIGDIIHSWNTAYLNETTLSYPILDLRSNLQTPTTDFEDYLNHCKYIQ